MHLIVVGGLVGLGFHPPPPPPAPPPPPGAKPCTCGLSYHVSSCLCYKGYKEACTCSPRCGPVPVLCGILFCAWGRPAVDLRRMMHPVCPASVIESYGLSVPCQRQG